MMMRTLVFGSLVLALVALVGCGDDEETVEGSDAASDTASDAGDGSGDTDTEGSGVDATDDATEDVAEEDTDAGGHGGDGGHGGTDADPVDADPSDVTPADGSADVDPVDPLSCERYCSLIEANCTDLNAQYPDEATCLRYCADEARLPIGTLDDREGNTVGCRIYHADVAVDDPDLHCPHAGPSGGDVCGTWCDNYCHLAETACTGELVLYADRPECETACLSIPATGVAGDPGGNTIQCRIYHLGIASGPDMPMTHCPHGAVDGGGICE
jgi:hypothetical protein